MATAPQRQVPEWLHPIQRAWNEKPIEFLTLIVAAITLVFLWLQLRDVRKSIDTQNDLLESQAYNYIVSGLLEHDKTFIENAKYRPYFLENRTVPPDTKRNEELRQKLLALADAKLDFIDSFFSQKRHINWEKRYTLEAWEKYFDDSFNCSAVLRQAFCRFKNEYGKDLNKFAAERWCDNAKPKPSKEPDKCKLEN